jgi:hypothetical protein
MAPRSSEAVAPARTPSRTYEIQKYNNGRWILDSVADDKKVAVEMATALMKSGRAPNGVQVMSVQQSSDGQFSQVRIYRATPNDPAPEAASKTPKVEAKPAPATPHVVSDFKHGAHNVSEKSKKKDLFFALKIAFGCGVTAAAAEAAYLFLR